MSHLLTFFEVKEIRELLSLKITSLKESKLFFNTVKDHDGSLLCDIELSIQEITDLKNLLNFPAA